MKKNPIPLLLPVLAVLFALIFCGGFGNSTEHLTFSIEYRSVSYFIVGDYPKLETVLLSNGRKVNIDQSTGEIITCESDDGINSFELSWGAGDNRKDTIIVQTSDGSGIKLDHKAIKSQLSADCPLLPLSEVEFAVTGPNKDCEYTLEINKGVLQKGYDDSDILVSMTGQKGPYTYLRSWERKGFGDMNIWVKSSKTDQELAISKGLKYKDCEPFVCDKATQDKLTREIKSALNAYILDYKNHSIFKKVSSGRTLTFIKDGKKVETSSFMAEIGVNGGNMKYGGSANSLKIISVSTSDCISVSIKYSEQ